MLRDCIRGIFFLHSFWCGVAPVLATGDGRSFLQTPTFTLAAIITFFLVISITFERSTHLIIWYLKKKKRHGLAAAAGNLISELTLIGFIALLLIVLQNPIHSICVSYQRATSASWVLLNHVKGCDCCLADTAGVGECFQAERNCGDNFCLCNGVDRCDVALEVRRLLADGSPSQGACNGMLPDETGFCPEGKYPLISFAALEQVHYFIFAVAVFHVGMGMIMVLLSSLRIALWRRWEVQELAHSQRAPKGVHGGPPLDGSAPSLTRLPGQEPLRHMLSRVVDAAAEVGSAVAAGPPVPLIGEKSPPLAEHALPGEGSRRASSEASSSTEWVHGDPGGALCAPPAGECSVRGMGEAGDGVPSGGRPPSLHTPAPHSSAARGSVPGIGGASEGPVGGTRGAVEDLSPEPSLHGQAGSVAGQDEVAVVIGEHGTGGSGNDHTKAATSSPQASRTSKLTQTLRPMVQRSGSIRTRRGWWREWAICLLLQFLPSPVSRQELMTMRTSFIMTHKLPHNFDFMKYINESMEDDFSQIVGVGLEMWVVMIIFILVSGLIGWPAILFLLISGTIQVVVNAKLIQITRHVCRGGRANMLQPNIFWFNRPSLLLHPLRMEHFLCSFIFATTVFFAAVFGPHSCPLGNSGFFFITPIWWVGLVLAGYLHLQLSLKTLPLYSLAVQMGGHYKKHMLPKRVRSRLLSVVGQVRQRRREESKMAKVQARESEKEMAGKLQRVLDVGKHHTKAVATTLVTTGKLLINPPEHE